MAELIDGRGHLQSTIIPFGSRCSTTKGNSANNKGDIESLCHRPYIEIVLYCEEFVFQLIVFHYFSSTDLCSLSCIVYSPTI